MEGIMRCPNCENENRDQAKFCDECGFPLTGAIARAAIESLPDEQDEVLVETEEAVEELSIASDDAELSIEDTQRIDVASDDFENEEAPEEVDSSEADEPLEQFEEEDEPEIAENPESLETQQVESEIEEDEPVRSFDEQATEVIGVDLSGFDRSYDYGERLVDPGYREPTIDWRDGGTMKMPRVEGEEPPKSRDYLESSKKKRSNKPKIIAGVIAGVVLVAAIVAFATYQMELWGGIAIPNVIGMTEADASSILEDEGFSVRSTKVKSDDTEGLVLVMDPDAGSRAEEGSEVIIHISTARAVPSVVGKSEQEAASAMEEEGFTNVVYEKQFSDEPAGTVLSIVPQERPRDYRESSRAVQGSRYCGHVPGRSPDDNRAGWPYVRLHVCEHGRLPRRHYSRVVSRGWHPGHRRYGGRDSNRTSARSRARGPHEVLSGTGQQRDNRDKQLRYRIARFGRVHWKRYRDLHHDSSPVHIHHG